MGMKVTYLLLLTGLLSFHTKVFSQYLPNPSFEGNPTLGDPPAGWSVCDACSTVDTEPGYLQSLAPSDGSTYIGMVGRAAYPNPDCTETCEACYSLLLTPLSPDSCYLISVDLAYNPYCYWNGHSYPNSLRLDIWAGNTSCSQEELLWSSPTPQTNWNTYTFELTPSFEISELFLQSNYATNNSYWGNVLVDNLVIENVLGTINLGNDTTLCAGQSLILDAGGGFDSYLWSDGSNGQSIEVTESGQYWVEGFAQSCSSTDTINVFIEPPIEIDLGNDTVVCTPQYELSVEGNFEEYFWSTGENTQSITVSEDGLYIVSVIDSIGCEGTDSVQVTFEAEQINIGNDTVLCVGENLVLDAGAGYTDYEWNTGANQQTIQIETTGNYWVVVTNEAGCQATDTILVVFEEETTVDLGNDTTICYGSTLTLSPGFYNLYEWQDGSEAPQLIITEPGEYWVNVLGGCDWASDTINVSFYPPVLPDLGPDTTICYDDVFILYPGNFSSYLWQNGETGPNFPVYETGYYSVTVTDINNCEGADEVFVKVGEPINLNSDTSFCEGSSILIDIGNDYDYYSWNTGDTTHYISIDSAGLYFVTAGMNIPGCEFLDTILVNKIPVPEVSIEDTNLCSGDTLVIEIEDEDTFNYFWNGIAGSNHFEVSQGGRQIVYVENECGSAIDTFNIVAFPNPAIKLFSDNQYLWNENEQAVINIEGVYDSCIWQDGSRDFQYIVSYEEALSQHLYYVEAYKGKCYASDSIFIESIKFGIPIFVSPNGDKINDRFAPKNWYGIKEHKMTVFNRWGQIVWESGNFQNGWDARSNSGRLVPDGTYYWVLRIIFEDEEVQRTYKGSLTILGGE